MGEVLRLDGVDFTRGDKRILTDINLTIEQGQRWVLIGPNGAGKTTVLNMCGAHQHPTNGRVYVLGHQLGRVDLRSLRESIGHVNPRHPLRRPLTTEQVIYTGATGTMDVMMRWQPPSWVVERTTELINSLGLGEVRHDTWPTLSQGERGRTLIARALLASPALLLLDEPTTGLDVAAREQFLATLDSLHRDNPDLATVVVTHHLEEIPTSTTHAALITDGRLLAAGSVHHVLRSDLVSQCFSYPITIDHRHGRWHARAQTWPG